MDKRVVEELHRRKGGIKKQRKREVNGPFTKSQFISEAYDYDFNGKAKVFVTKCCC